MYFNPFLTLQIWKKNYFMVKRYFYRTYNLLYVFSPNRPTGPIRSSSGNVHIFIYMSPRASFLAWGPMCRKSVIKSQHEVVFWIGRPKNKELFWITYMYRPSMEGVRLVDWWTCWPTRRALKTRSFSRLHPCKAHAWELFDWWTCAFVDQLVEP